MSERIYCADWFADNEAPVAAALQPLVGQPVHGLEIGSFEGRSACWFFDNVLTHPDSTLTCIDPFIGSTDLSASYDFAVIKSHFLHNVAPFGNRCVWYGFKSTDALRTMNDKRFDFVYVDGSHEMWDALADIVGAFRVTKQGGYIICDDYHWHPEYSSRPAVAIDAALQCFAPLITVLHKGHCVIFRKE